jgi:hypothetical protein
LCKTEMVFTVIENHAKIIHVVTRKKIGKLVLMLRRGSRLILGSRGVWRALVHLIHVVSSDGRMVSRTLGKSTYCGIACIEGSTM